MLNLFQHLHRLFILLCRRYDTQQERRNGNGKRRQLSSVHGGRFVPRAVGAAVFAPAVIRARAIVAHEVVIIKRVVGG